jgi:hypothetical protein
MKSKIVEVGSFVIVPERIALGKRVEEVIGSVTKISYPSGEKDFAYVEVLFFNNESRWYPEYKVYSQKEAFLIKLVGMEQPLKAISILGKLVQLHKLQPVYVTEPQGEWVNGQFMLVESEKTEEEETSLPPSGGEGGESFPREEKKEKEVKEVDLKQLTDMVPDFEDIVQEDPENTLLPKEEAKFVKIAPDIAVMLIGRIGLQRSFTLANIIVFIRGKIYYNNRLNKSLYNSSQYIKLEFPTKKEEYAAISKSAKELYKQGKVFDFTSFEEVKNFLKEIKKNKKEETKC